MRLSLALLFLTSTASADKMSAAAQAKLEAGVELHEAGDYAAAVEAFREGFQLQPHRDFLYAIGQSERKRGNCKAAIDAYRAFLAEKPPAKEAHKAETNIRRCEVKLAEQPDAAPGDPRSGPGPGSRPEPATQVEPEPAPTPPVSVPPERAPPAAPAPATAPAPIEADDGSRLDWVTTTLYAAGGMSIAVGGALLIMANGSANEANSAGTLEDYEDKRIATRNLRYGGYATIVVGTALVGAGVVRMVLRDREATVGTALLPGGAAVVVGGRF